MKSKLLAALCGITLLCGSSIRAQDSDSKNIAKDEVESMNKLDMLIGKAQKRLEYIMTNLIELTDGDDKNNSFDKFKENLDDLHSIRDDIKDRAEKVRELQGKRVAAWTKEVSGMTDKDMRNLTNDQIDKDQGSFGALDKQMRVLGGDANDLTGLLEDLKKYFSSSFSADSVNAAKTQIEGAKKSAREMVTAADALRDLNAKYKKMVEGTVNK